MEDKVKEKQAYSNRSMEAENRSEKKIQNTVP